MTWNPVLNFFFKVKSDFSYRFGAKNLYNYENDGTGRTCIEYWIDALGVQKYKDMIAPLFLNEFNGMLLFKYNTLDVDFDAYDCFYRECRSVVIDIHKNCLVLTPFKKFFNLNERPETQLSVIQEKIKNAKKIEIVNKLDGSMVSARYYNGEIVISGSQALDVNKSFRLENYYKFIAEHPNFARLIQDSPNYTYIFEGIFSNDPHVVQYDEDMIGLHFIGARNVNDGAQVSAGIIKYIGSIYNVPTAEIYDMTFADVIKSIDDDEYSANEREGFVITVDDYKFKVKYNDYRLIHNFLGKLVSPNYVIDAYKSGKYDDFYAKVPAVYQPAVAEIFDTINAYCNKVNMYVDMYYNLVINSGNLGRKDAMIFITENVPIEFRGFVRMKWLGRPYDILKGRHYQDMLAFLE